MKFGRIPVDEAEGAVLAHSIRLPKSAFKKGRLLTRDDLEALRSAQIHTVVAARLETGDVAEDEAATAVADAVRGPGMTASAAFTGRVNLFAEAAGVLRLDTARLDRINLVDETVTVATLPADAVVEARQMVATIKIIPFAAPRAAVDACVAVARAEEPPTRVAAFRPKRVALIQTRLDGMKESILDKTVAVTRGRIEGVGGELVHEDRCPHEEEAVAAAIARARDAGCDILLIAGASAIVDRRDVLPAGIERAGGRVVHFGMPVDPGNLILMGDLGGAPVVGLPGCARSPKFNGFDQVLQRLAADIPVEPRDIMLMGVGGLLTEIASRPLPRAQATRKPQPDDADGTTAGGPQRAPRIAALVLAAGLSRRMGPANKLLAEVDGRAMVTIAVDAVQASKAGPVTVVTGHEGERVRAALAGRDVTFVDNPRAAEGLAGSLKAGLEAVPDDADGVIVCLGDMPRVTAAHIDRLIAAFNPVEGRAICVPTWRGKRGNPVLWGRRFFEEMRGLGGDVGAKRLIGEYDDLVAEVAMADDGILLDVDTPDALAALTRNGAADRSGPPR